MRTRALRKAHCNAGASGRVRFRAGLLPDRLRIRFWRQQDAQGYDNSELLDYFAIRTAPTHDDPVLWWLGGDRHRPDEALVSLGQLLWPWLLINDVATFSDGIASSQAAPAPGLHFRDALWCCMADVGAWPTCRQPLHQDTLFCAVPPESLPVLRVGLPVDGACPAAMPADALRSLSAVEHVNEASLPEHTALSGAISYQFPAENGGACSVAATACTIVSGAIAERARFEAYILFSLFMASWVGTCALGFHELHTAVACKAKHLLMKACGA